jgi:hypothetical protein
MSLAVLFTTPKFHHLAHAAEWTHPDIDAAYDAVWQMLMNGLCAPKSAGKGATASKTRLKASRHR